MPYDTHAIDAKLEKYGYLLARKEDEDHHLALARPWTRTDHEAGEVLILENGVWYPHDPDRFVEVRPPKQRTRHLE